MGIKLLPHAPVELQCSALTSAPSVPGLITVALTTPWGISIRTAFWVSSVSMLPSKNSCSSSKTEATSA